MRELISFGVFFVALQVAKINLLSKAEMSAINYFFLILASIVLFCAMLFLCGAIVERVVMKTKNWFRITPGKAQIAPFNDGVDNPADKPADKPDKY